MDKQVGEAAARGDFDDLPGKGKPIAGLERDDELWWVRDKLKRENLSYLPPALELKKRVFAWLESLADVPSEAAVTRAAEAFNDEIRDMNRTAVTGPPSTLVPLAVEDILSRWREARDAATP